MPRAYLACCIALMFCMSGGASENDYRELSILQVQAIEGEQGENGFAVMAPVKCGSDGSIIVRFYSPNTDDGVTIVTPDHKRTVRLGIEGIPELQGASLKDFTSGQNHDVFLLAEKSEGPKTPVKYYVIRQTADLKTTVTELNVKPGFAVQHIAELGSDEFVMSGYISAQSVPQAFTAIVKSDGDIARLLTLEGDLSAKDESKKSAPGALETVLRSWIDLSALQTADDGQAYLSRPNVEGPVFIISPGGEVRRLTLRPPADPNVKLVSVKLSGNRIAAEYTGKKLATGFHEHFIIVTNLDSGSPETKIRVDGGIVGVGMVCFREQQMFDFLSQSPSGHLQVVTAAPR